MCLLFDDDVLAAAPPGPSMASADAKIEMPKVRLPPSAEGGIQSGPPPPGHPAYESYMAAKAGGGRNLEELTGPSVILETQKPADASAIAGMVMMAPPIRKRPSADEESDDSDW